MKFIIKLQLQTEKINKTSKVSHKCHLYATQLWKMKNGTIILCLVAAGRHSITNVHLHSHLNI